MKLYKKMKLFYDLLSQPSRTLFIYLKLNKIPFEACPVALRKGEHLTEDFKEKCSKFGKVPFIHDGDFRLTESVAIVRYLSEKYNVNEPLYPKDAQLRGKIDEYLEWQHHNIRANCSMYFIMKCIEPLFKEVPDKKLAAFKKRMEKSLVDIQELFLKDQEYLAGNSFTVADIFAATEIDQLRATGYDPKDNRPVLAAWLDRVKSNCEPYYSETHEIVERFAKKSKL
ncbi:unnamed protein product [Brassicogethes aeneus]|uniref:Uncharacterized protein n=1 Tax=Brassicogethes aeneus TaxID=1431903 RepID=A0A9P0BH84_BRAAE|nr:unnamed protein product [Brassicogethes aeneus]